MPFNGFLNSCAADAKAIVFILERFFYFSNSTQCDMSLIVVITMFVEPISTICEKTYSYLLGEILLWMLSEESSPKYIPSKLLSTGGSCLET